MKRKLTLLIVLALTLSLFAACGEKKTTNPLSRADTIDPRNAYAGIEVVQPAYFRPDMIIKSLKTCACEAVGVGGTITRVTEGYDCAVDRIMIVDGYTADGTKAEYQLNYVTGKVINSYIGDRPYENYSMQNNIAIDAKFSCYVLDEESNTRINVFTHEPISNDQYSKMKENNRRDYIESINKSVFRANKRTRDELLAMTDYKVTPDDLIEKAVPEYEKTAYSFKDLAARQFFSGVYTIQEIVPIQNFAGDTYYVITADNSEPIEGNGRHMEVLIHGQTGASVYISEGIITTNENKYRENLFYSRLPDSYDYAVFQLQDGKYVCINNDAVAPIQPDSKKYEDAKDITHTLYNCVYDFSKVIIDASTLDNDMNELIGCTVTYGNGYVEIPYDAF